MTVTSLALAPARCWHLNRPFARSWSPASVRATSGGCSGWGQRYRFAGMCIRDLSCYTQGRELGSGMLLAAVTALVRARLCLASSLACSGSICSRAAR